jgi:hypothetical protein
MLACGVTSGLILRVGCDGSAGAAGGSSAGAAFGGVAMRNGCCCAMRGQAEGRSKGFLSSFSGGTVVFVFSGGPCRGRLGRFCGAH